MLAEFIEAISEQAVKAAGHKIDKPAAEPSHVYYFDGKRYTASPAPRHHIASDLSAVVEFARLAASQDADAGGE